MPLVRRPAKLLVALSRGRQAGRGGHAIAFRRQQNATSIVCEREEPRFIQPRWRRCQSGMIPIASGSTPVNALAPAGRCSRVVRKGGVARRHTLADDRPRRESAIAMIHPSLAGGQPGQAYVARLRHATGGCHSPQSIARRLPDSQREAGFRARSSVSAGLLDGAASLNPSAKDESGNDQQIRNFARGLPARSRCHPGWMRGHTWMQWQPSRRRTL